MIARAFQILGIVALVGAVGASVVALSVVRDRVQIIVRDPGTSDAPDPVAVVKDDLRQVHQDLDAIRQAMATNLERIATHLAAGDSTARERQEAVRRAASERDAAERSIATRLEQIERAVQAIELRLRGSTGARTESVASTPKPAPPTPAQPTTPAQPPTNALSKAATAPPPPASQPVAPPAKRAGFLAFDLPSRGFRFATRQTFRILGSLSRVGFDAKSTLHDFSGVTSRVDGGFTAALGDPASTWNGSVECDAATLRTGVDGRDRGLREHLRTDRDPKIRFVIQGFRSKSVDAAKQTATGTIRGTMSIRGKVRPFEMPVQVSIDQSYRVVIDGQATLKLTDYGIPVPSQLGVISMQDEVKVWIALRARSTGASKE
ncbi:MAG: YceI family protein [Planctomycetes bacterium]|nr:YceI family protein [Planctomycetota bacterium]MCB9869150.1 YceI family protein [Planctomycetota bacterium]MCB9889014.1 YceI family protein [Planctomycetota bacterium]